MMNTTAQQLNQSYWQVTLASGRVLSEWHAEWLEDLVGTGDIGQVVEATLYTPAGAVQFAGMRPYSVFQLHIGIADLFGGQRIQTAHVLGVVDGTEGECVCAIWDAVEQRLYQEFHTNVLDFASGRAGVAPLGRLNIEALAVQL